MFTWKGILVLAVLKNEAVNVETLNNMQRYLK